RFQDADLNSRDKLDWQRWSRQMGLDSLAYYQFLYPQQGLFNSYSPTSDSLTQFAPFVVDEGRVEPVHVIFVDEVPVYFSHASTAPAYAFPADSGYHHLKLRTARHIIHLDSVYFRQGQKL